MPCPECEGGSVVLDPVSAPRQGHSCASVWQRRHDLHAVSPPGLPAQLPAAGHHALPRVRGRQHGAGSCLSTQAGPWPCSVSMAALALHHTHVGPAQTKLVAARLSCAVCCWRSDSSAAAALLHCTVLHCLFLHACMHHSLHTHTDSQVHESPTSVQVAPGLHAVQLPDLPASQTACCEGRQQLLPGTAWVLVMLAQHTDFPRLQCTRLQCRSWHVCFRALYCKRNR